MYGAGITVLMLWPLLTIIPKMFDFQKPSGNIPDSVNDAKIIHNYCKPPIHGWTLRKLMGIMAISHEQLMEAYEKLSKWTYWWLNCRDENGDGLCEYTHGNDSGWDNATAFAELPPVTLPDIVSSYHNREKTSRGNPPDNDRNS